MERKSYIVAVDLGSSSVVVAVAAREEKGAVVLKSLVSKPSQGVNAGRIDNIEQVSQALGAAIEEAGEAAGIRITEAYAGISGEFLRCARHTDYVYVSDPQNGVAQGDVAALFDRMRNLQAPDDETIMERIPQLYLIDDKQEVADPIGSFGRKLSSTFNFVLCQRTPMQRLDMALKRVGVKLIGTIPNPMAVAEAVLTEDEKEEGVAVVDIGGGVTDVAVCYRNVVRYVASIPIGASAINHDIRTMGVPERFVESLKQQYGSAVAERVSEEKLIRVTGRTARESRDILLRNLSTVIEARAMDIIDFVNEELKISGYAGKLAYGIVLTGGSAKLRDLDELFRLGTKLEVRVATPEAALDAASQPSAADPAYATVVGLLLKGAERSTAGVSYVQGAEPKPVQKPAAKGPATPSQAQQQPVRPARPAEGGEEPAASSDPARRPGPEPQPAGREYSYVPPVVPAAEAQPASGKPEKPELPDDADEVDEGPTTSGHGFWGWVRRITEKFETPDNEEI